ncbi:hypothetical protein SK128_019366 [Halocaridina rubra]|uniref:Uncharacterized protein n=1 Tax=Halocaridina rubra TaxID=373956 RepID=A0AAN8XKF2_HALRR
MPVGMRAGWVPCVGFQPLKPSVVMMEDTENPIAQECEKAFKRIRDANPEEGDAAATEAAAVASPGSGFEIMEDEPVRTPEKPPMKLLMSSRGVQDFQQVQEHYQNLMNQAPQSPEVNKLVTEIASPTGKGAELFAKRKKRMDKFIVDETTVQKSQQTSMTQQQSFSSSSTSNFNATSISSQNVTSGASSAVATDGGAGAIYTAEVKVVQRASLPPTPIDIPHHNLLDMVTVEDSKLDKRRSASFNLAAKGWGTYNNFYTPISFATQS